MKYGLPVPSSFVIPTFVYSLHIEKAGVVDLIDEVFESDLRDEAVRVAAKSGALMLKRRIATSTISSKGRNFLTLSTVLPS